MVLREDTHHGGSVNKHNAKFNFIMLITRTTAIEKLKWCCVGTRTTAEGFKMGFVLKITYPERRDK